jgi:hypothetical protein
MAAASLQRMVSRHTRLTCGHGTRLLARSEAMVRLTVRAFVYRSSWSPLVIIAGRVVTVDDAGGAHWVLIQ